MSSIFLKVCSNIIYLCFYQFVKLSFLSVRWQKMALLVLLKGRLVGGAKPNVPFVRWQFKIFCAVGKKLKHRRVGNECRLTPCPFVVSFLCLCSPIKMVCFFLVFSRLFVVVGSSFTLAANGSNMRSAGCQGTSLSNRYAVY